MEFDNRTFDSGNKVVFPRIISIFMTEWKPEIQRRQTDINNLRTSINPMEKHYAPNTDTGRSIFMELMKPEMIFCDRKDPHGRLSMPVVQRSMQPVQ